MILKIQRPLVTNADMSMCLIYNRDRSIKFHMKMDVNKVFGTVFKVYVEAQLTKNCSGYNVNIKKHLIRQPW